MKLTNILLKTMDSAVKYLFTVKVDTNTVIPIQLTRTTYNYKGLGGMFKGGKAQNRIDTIKKYTVKALGFVEKCGFLAECDCNYETPDYLKDHSSGSFKSNELSAKQRHDMDSNGLSRSEAIANPHW